MGTSKEEIRSWLERGKKLGATHMIVVCDIFDYSDYPTYVFPGEDVRLKEKELDNYDKMSRVMEVYSFKLDFEEQLKQRIAFNYD